MCFTGMFDVHPGSRGHNIPHGNVKPIRLSFFLAKIIHAKTVLRASRFPSHLSRTLFAVKYVSSLRREHAAAIAGSLM